MTERRPLVLKEGTVSELPQQDVLSGVQVFHGFPVPYEVTLSYSKTTRQVTITPLGSAFTVWVGGVAYVKSEVQTSTAHANATDSYYLYYNTAGVLEWSTTLWDMKIVSPVCEVYYDTVPADGIALYELHTYKRNLEWHESQHFAIGTFVRSGLEASGYALNAEGNAAVTFQVASGIIVDEDIEFAISTLADGGPYTILRRTGASNYTWSSTAAVPFLSGASYIQYNQNSGGTWQMTDAVASRFVNYYLYATTALDISKRLFLIPGQAVHSNLSAAQAESSAALNLTGLALAEFVGIWKFTFNTNNNYSATGKVRLVEVNRITNTKGALSVNLTTTNHSLLTGRETLDSHPASAVTNTPAGNIAAIDVQAALNELDSEKVAVSAIGVSVQAYDPDIPTVPASQSEMEAGAESAVRSMSPLRVKQAATAAFALDAVYDYLLSLGKLTFDPTELFYSGGDGAWYDFNAADVLYQNSNGTTAASTGDPVAYVGDSSGNTNPALQDSLLNHSGLVSIGYQYLTDLSVSTALTIPSGTLQVIIRPVGQTIRWLTTGSAVTSGTGTALAPPSFYMWGLGTTLANIRVIEETAGASLHVHYYG